MLIPKIIFTGSTDSTGIVPVITNFSFIESSDVSEGITVTGWTWTHTILSGSSVAVIGGASDTQEFTIGFTTVATYRARVELTTTDSLNRTAKTSILIINDGVNTNVIFLGVTAYVLPNGLVTYLPDNNQTTIVGAALYSGTVFFNTYQIDYTNNTSYDDTNTDLSIFENQFATTDIITSRLSITDTVNSIAIDELYTEVTLTPVIENPKDVIVTTNSDCTVLTVSSESKDYIEQLTGRVAPEPTTEFIGLEIEQNCCNNTMNFELAPRYNLVADGINGTEQSLPEIVNINGNNYNTATIDILITGIDATLVQSIQYTSDYNSGSTLYTSNSPNTLTINVMFLIENPLGSGFPVIVENKTILITTINGDVYTINYTISPNVGLGNVLDVVVVTTSLGFPPFPDGITVVENVNNTVINISSSIYSSDKFFDGVYQVTLSNSDISNSFITGCTFVDCETRCLVISALAHGCDPMVQVLYDALIQFNSCLNIPCTNLCDLYAYLETLLDECDCAIFQNNVISGENRCGCVSQNKY